MPRLIARNRLEKVAPLIRAAAHPVRLRILDLLQAGPASVGEIADATGCSQAATSQHLAVLRREGILSTSRDGRKVLYQVERTELFSLLDCIRLHCKRR